MKIITTKHVDSETGFVFEKFGIYNIRELNEYYRNNNIQKWIKEKKLNSNQVSILFKHINEASDLNLSLNKRNDLYSNNSLQKLIDAGVCPSYIANICNCDTRTVYRKMKEIGINKPKHTKINETSNKAKKLILNLSVYKISAMLNDGENIESIAKRFLVSKVTMKNFIKNNNIQ